MRMSHDRAVANAGLGAAGMALNAAMGREPRQIRWPCAATTDCLAVSISTKQVATARLLRREPWIRRPPVMAVVAHPLVLSSHNDLTAWIMARDAAKLSAASAAERSGAASMSEPNPVGIVRWNREHVAPRVFRLPVQQFTRRVEPVDLCRASGQPPGSTAAQPVRAAVAHARGRARTRTASGLASRRRARWG